MFPISRDPPEGGTFHVVEVTCKGGPKCFQFLGIPPKGERDGYSEQYFMVLCRYRFQFLGIPPKGEQNGFFESSLPNMRSFQFLGIPPKGERDIPEDAVITWGRFPISRDPPEGGTSSLCPRASFHCRRKFPVSRDPPEGGTAARCRPNCSTY